MESHYGYCGILHTKIDQVEKVLAKHHINKYLLGLEKCENTHVNSNGEHIHFLLYIDPSFSNIKNFKENMRVTFGLGGKTNKKGKPYYGWGEKEIKNHEKLASYTVKDNNIRSMGFTQEELDEFIKNSFPKNEERNLFKECINAIDRDRPHLSCNKSPESLTLDYISLEIYILKFHMENDVKICKSKIKNIALAYLQLHYNDRYKHLEEIYYYIRNN